jgi:hypothetical protein
MIPEEQAAAGRVDGDEVDHQVLGRGVRRGGPEELLSRGNPREDAGLISRLARVVRLDRRHEFRDKSANVVVWHGPFLRLGCPPGRTATGYRSEPRNGTLAGARATMAGQHHAGVAQLAEHPPCKRTVSGSNPLTGSRSEALSGDSLFSPGAKQGAKELRSQL